MDVAEIEQQDAQEVDQFYDDEANDIRDFRGTDADGVYYEEDGDNDFAEE